MKLELNPNARLTWLEVGPARTTVLVIDGCLRNVGALRSFALSLGYQPPMQGKYPGLQATASLAGAGELSRWLAEAMLARTLPRGRPSFVVPRVSPLPCQFSILSCDRARLPKNFTDQHADPHHWLACVLHLSRASGSRGTAMWAHRPTGIQHWMYAPERRLGPTEDLLGLRFTAQIGRARRKAVIRHTPALSGLRHPQRREEYQRCLDLLGRYLFRADPERRPFSTDEDDKWKLLDVVPARLNRMVVYPSWQIHSAIDMADDREVTPDNVRLTMNLWAPYPLPRAHHPHRESARSAYRPTFYRPLQLAR